MGYTVGGSNAMPLLSGANIPNEPITGIDIPILIGNPNATSHKGTIMILEQDPLRRLSQFQKMYTNAQLQNNAIVGTPNAFHFNPVKFYLLLVANLIADGWSVYLTDTYKVWAPNLAKNKNRLTNNEINLLCQEIATIKPTIVLLFGTEAKNAYNMLQCPLQLNIKTVAVPHPSGLANRAWKDPKYLGTNPLTDNNKIKFILSQV